MSCITWNMPMLPGYSERIKRFLGVAVVINLLDMNQVGYVLNAKTDEINSLKRLIRQLKILIVNHKNINYEFRLLEQAKVIQVTKGIDNLFEELSYEMHWNGRQFRCNCPGSKFHGKCWHSGMVNLLCQQLSINEPWTTWAEESVR